MSFAPHDDHTKPHTGVTTYQLAFFLIFLAAVFLWLIKKVWYGDSKNGCLKEVTNGAAANADVKITVSNDLNAPANKTEVAAAKKETFSKVIPPPTVDEFLLQVIQLGGFMIFFYLCDYIKVFPVGERVYSRDTFLFLVFLLFFVGCLCTLKPTTDQILNRDHTEEWKGWMQVMFVWYHYFAAKEWYNWIRIYIASYVWMTGFGNFSFFWVRKDFSLWRALKMLFRLDFMVIVICFTVSNEYMAYYICAMHTYWFFSVYAMMGVYSSWNNDRYKMALKFVVYFVMNIVVFEIPGVFGWVFWPLTPILGLDDGHGDLLFEWRFRLTLDHWVCFFGMLCAYNYPYFERLIKHLESAEMDVSCFGIRRGNVIKVIMVALLVGLYAVWHVFVLPLDKFAYNALHPYTSIIPIFVYIMLRNMYQRLRKVYIHLFAWLGKVTLETYLSQLHIYLQSNARHLLVYLPGYHLLNFSLATLVYLFVSFNLFNITTEISAFLIPQDVKLMRKNVAMTAGVVFSAAIAAFVIKLLYSV